MLEILTAFVATTYTFSALFLSFFIICAHDKELVRQAFGNTWRRYLFIIETMSSGVAELSIQLIILKLFQFFGVYFMGGFNYKLSSVVFYLDVLNLLGLCHLYYQMLLERSIADETIRKLNHTAKPMASILCNNDIKKLVNPFWTPSRIKIHPNITYATNEEIREVLETSNQDFSQLRRMMLDIYTRADMPQDRASKKPVLVHVHGGAWRAGSKNLFYPYEKLLVKENDWIIVNIGYRLAPKNSYPAHLIDVKRAIRWLKQNIASFGGDPNYIILAGDSAGAHLASMASMTVNDPRFQPGFEEVDTSVQGVVSLSGALDLMNEPHTAIFFCKRVAGLDNVDTVFLSDNSPAALISKKKNVLVPYLLVAGEKDSLTNSRISKEFKATFDEEKEAPECTLILLPAGHHINYINWSPRSLYVARAIQSWCVQLYKRTNHNKSIQIESKR
ncbi:Alpha/Beta hydrolase protein [Mycotypha africana]|uniref:Alpha/Beta hydrolase protein n=1 Tax=Mycotypha africana TaxID=64632 RepID=UPI00230170A0|nr:Alpha/Beta hydrolase protein [Mycotypha africana]KAI8975204.1 Alpha/Beta hydrolase protein [Mycotypha africana]